MPSANGFKLEVSTRSGGKHTLVAHWPAPYFVFIDDTEKAEHIPMLYHAESLEHAREVASVPADGKIVILDAQFNALEFVTVI
jgi:hypothetical protein